MLIDINVRFDGNEKEEAAGLLNYICGNKNIRNAKVDVQPDPQPKKAEAKPEPLPKPLPKPEKTVTENPAILVAPQEKPEVKPAKAYTLEDVRDASKELITRRGSDVYKELLKEFGVSKLPDLAPEKYAELMEAINAR